MDLLRQRLLLTVLPAAVVLGLVWAAVMGESGLLRHMRMQSDLERVHRRLAALQADNAILAREVEQLRSDETTVRRAVAEELLLVPPDSTVYRFE